MTYDVLKSELDKALKAAEPLRVLSRDQVVDWAYGTCVIENKAVTRDMAERAADARPSQQR